MASRSLTPSPPRQLAHLATFTPSTQCRQWSSAPHPTLPLVAVCGADKAVRVYSLTNFRLLATIGGGHERSVRSCAWKPPATATPQQQEDNMGNEEEEEVVLATGSFDATVGIWKRANPHTGTAPDPPDEDEDAQWRFAVLLDGHESEVKAVAWSPPHPTAPALLATCSRDKSIWLWEDLSTPTSAPDDDSFETVAVLQDHAADVKCLAWHPHAQPAPCLASGSYDNTVRVWREDADDWAEAACLRAHAGTVWALAWEGARAEAPRLASASADCSVRVWRRVGGREAAAPERGRVPSILRPAEVEEEWEVEATLPAAHELAVYSVAWSGRTGLMASAGADGRVVVYEEEKEAAGKWRVVCVTEAAHEEYEVNHVAWANRQGEEVLLSTGDDGKVRVWHFAEGEASRP